MSLIFKLAARNLRRHLRRTLITASSISFGLAFLIFGSVMQDGMHRDTVKIAVSSMSGHVVVQGIGYQEDRDAKIVVPGASARMEKLAAEFKDGTVVPRIFLGGLLTSPHGAMGVGLTAVDPKVETTVSDLHEKVVEGEFVGDNKTDIVIGATLAESLDVKLGDKVVLMMQSGKEVQSQLFRVKGVFKSGVQEMDGFFAIITVPAAQQMLGVIDAVSQLAVVVDIDDDLEGLRARASAVAGGEGVEVLTWPESIPEVYEYIVLDDVGMWIFLLVIILMASVGVLNTVLMSVLERVREFGVMLSLGMSQGRLAGVVLMESLIIGCIAGLIGLGMGLALGGYLGTYGIDYGPMMGGETMEVAGVAVSTMLYGYVDYPKAILFTVLTVFVTAAAGLYPVWWASRLTPVKALAHR
jgi:ABC-type lipoprotein release transport system permease subunit